MKQILFILVSLFFFYFQANSQESSKKILTHSDYDYWKKIESTLISPNGMWVSYEINPQKGDGFLYVVNVNNFKKDSIARGYDAQFSSNSDFIIFKIKPQEDSTRNAKLQKLKKEKFPKDSLGIWIFKTERIIKIPLLYSYAIPKENSSWLAYLTQKNSDTSDTLTVNNKQDSINFKEKKKKEQREKKSKLKEIDTYNLTYENIKNCKTYTAANVVEYTFSKSPNLFGFVTLNKDTIDSTSVFVFDVKKDSLKCVFKKRGYAKKLVFDEQGNQISFIFTSDTAKIKHYSLYYYDIIANNLKIVVDSSTNGMKYNWEVNENAKYFFSQDGSKLYLGTAPKQNTEVKDTLLEEEKVKLDIWNWKDEIIQPKQLKDIDKDKKKTYLAVYLISKNIFLQLEDSLIDKVKLIQKGDANIALGISFKSYKKINTIEDLDYQDAYLIDLLTGNKKKLLTQKPFDINLSPFGNYLYWYEPKESVWYSFNINKNLYTALTKPIPVKFCDEENDEPKPPSPYGIAGWTGNDKEILIYDRYDIWKVNPEYSGIAINITNGRDKKINFRYINLDKEALFINAKEKLLLKSINFENYQEGFCILKNLKSKEIKQIRWFENNISNPVKSKNTDFLIWQKSSYTEYADLWVSDIDFKKSTKVSNANPQQKDFWWGTVEPVKWQTNNNEELKGLLYKPENFDASKKYPMIVYFYEKNSDKIYTNIVPAPSRSVINFPLYNSNGYLIFVPDIKYTEGFPGKSAVDAIISGTNAMIDKGFVDKDNIGLQGQSWGGYQVAFIVTQTSMFKAAMAGAPVSNMTSAYGGIRWESGVARMFQYEHGQSRIGGTLWNKQSFFIQNSPLFQADKIATPLLIMSNDNDGAVPWQQGIELYNALWRLDKPVWLLNYNGDEHNLTKRPNRIDLSIRMLQFFDYYLKGAPMPKWMNEGIPAIKKGIDNGYELK